MRLIVASAALLVLTSAPAAAVQLAPAGAQPSEGPSLRGSMEPDLSTDAVSLENVRNNMSKDRTKGRAKAKGDQPRPAALTDVSAGKPVHDTSGQMIALIEKIEADGAVLRAGALAVKVPLDGFGINRKGLLLNMTKPQFDELVASVNPAPRS